jgi:hypothetical protein
MQAAAKAKKGAKPNQFFISDHTLIKKVRELFTSLYERRVLVRLLGVRLTHSIAGTYHLNLFEDTQDMITSTSLMIL